MLLRPIAFSAFALLAATAVHAQSKLNMYGEVDLSLGSFQDSNNTNAKAVTKVESNLMVTSYLGFKGVEDLGGGLKAGFAIESFLRPDVGASGRSGTDVFWGRAANVYLQGGFGKLTLGRQGNLPFLQAAGFNPFGGAFGLSPTIRLTYGKWGNDKGDSGWSNALAYQTPAMGGFTGTVQVQPGEKTDGSEAASVVVGGAFSSGPFSIAASYQTLRSAEAPKADLAAGQKQKFALLGSSYDFGVAKLFAQFGEYKNTGYGAASIKTTLYQLGASVPVTSAGKVLLSYGQSTEKPIEAGTTVKTKHSITTLAYDHFLSKRTDIYTAFMLDDEKLPGYKSGKTYAVGIRHKF
jgi:predicted porin